MSGQESLTLAGVDSKLWLNYLEQICEVFRGEIPHVKHPKLDYAEFKQKQQIDSMEEFAKLRRFAAMKAAAAAAPAAAIPMIVPGPGAGAGAGRKSSNYHEEERMKRSRRVLGAESGPSNAVEGGLKVFLGVLIGIFPFAVASPQTDTTKRAKKRRSYEKFGNIVSIAGVGRFLVAVCLVHFAFQPPFARMVGFDRFFLEHPAHRQLVAALSSGGP